MRANPASASWTLGALGSLDYSYLDLSPQKNVVYHSNHSVRASIAHFHGELAL